MDAFYTIKAYRTQDGECPFRKWYGSLRDTNVRVAINDRLDRLAMGNVGDCKSVGSGVYELRIHCGPGYRAYFAYQDGHVVLLLAGSDKSRQDATIKKAQEYLTEYQNRAGGPL